MYDLKSIELPLTAWKHFVESDSVPFTLLSQLQDQNYNIGIGSSQDQAKAYHSFQHTYSAGTRSTFLDESSRLGLANRVATGAIENCMQHANDSGVLLVREIPNTIDSMSESLVDLILFDGGAGFRANNKTPIEISGAVYGISGNSSSGQNRLSLQNSVSAARASLIIDAASNSFFFKEKTYPPRIGEYEAIPNHGVFQRYLVHLLDKS